MLNVKNAVLVAGMILLAATGVQAGTATTSNVSQPFKFKFELHKPLVYAMEIQSTKVTDSNIGGHTSLVKNFLTIRIKYRLTALSTNQNCSTTVRYEPFDFEQETDVNNSAGHWVASQRDLEIVARQNDILVIDTTNGIGIGDARALKQATCPMMLSGYFDIDAAGNVLKIDGDLPFQDFWQEKLKNCIGFFQILFPTNAVPIADSWTNNLALKGTDGVTISGDGVVQKYVFNRTPDESTTSNGLQACFSAYESESGKSYSGYIERSGQRTSIAFPDRVGSINTTFHFDIKNGRLVEMKKSERLDDSLSMMMQGKTSSSHGNLQVETVMRLVTP
jgi:hypothetical protein